MLVKRFLSNPSGCLAWSNRSSPATATAYERIHAENLTTIRQAANLTHRALAAAMGVNQSEVSRIESRSDLLLSTLASYLAAAGAEPSGGPHPRRS